MFTRASDLGVSCWAQWFLSHYYVEELPDAGFFILGTSIHDSIEAAILNDLNDIETFELAKDAAWQALEKANEEERGVIWSKKRTAQNLDETIELVINNWFLDVHPDSEERHPVYNLYQWPPLVEYPIELPDAVNYGLFTRPDAIFEHKSGKFHAVVDWKSGATAKSSDIQLWTYRYGLQKLGINVQRGWFHHLAFRKLQDIETWPNDEYIEMRIREAEVVKENQLFTPRPDWYCDYCRAQSLCPMAGGGLDWDGMMDDIEASTPMYEAIREEELEEPKV
jgi:CRISPR/Cas system-associated exonuclease Cas4 (RecB family)